VEQLGAVQTAGYKKTVLEWFSETDYGGKQSDSYDLRHPGTGSWLLDSTEFTQWKGNRGETLFCPGMPGAGKTILTSVVVQTIRDSYACDPNVATAWLYCDYRLKSEQTFNNLLGSLVRQLCLNQMRLPSIVEELYKQNEGRSTRPSIADLDRSLGAAITSTSRVFVLVDALDECADNVWQLLRKLFELQAKHNINLFATSREIPGIMEQFTGLPKVEIRASDQDIRAYLDGYLRDHIGAMPSCVRKSAALQHEVKDAILTTADGMCVCSIISIVGCH
jgi:hypothetical protein